MNVMFNIIWCFIGMFRHRYEAEGFLPCTQNLESKLASCREYVNEQKPSRRGHAGGQGAASGQSSSSDTHPTNGLYNKG